jgi:hypothetical protein
MDYLHLGKRRIRRYSPGTEANRHTGHFLWCSYVGTRMHKGHQAGKYAGHGWGGYNADVKRLVSRIIKTEEMSVYLGADAASNLYQVYELLCTEDNGGTITIACRTCFTSVLPSMLTKSCA